MIKISQKGDWSKTNNFLERALNLIKLGKLDIYGRQGVEVLSEATPRDTGKTANSWYYEIKHKKGSVSIYWCNSNTSEGVPIVIFIQYDRVFQNGVVVQGTDFINPAMKHAFDDIANNIWKELTK